MPTSNPSAARYGARPSRSVAEARQAAAMGAAVGRRVRMRSVEECGDRVRERDLFSFDARDVADAQNGRDVIHKKLTPLASRG